MNIVHYSSRGLGIASENTSKSAFVEGVGHVGAKYYVEGLRIPPTPIHCWGMVLINVAAGRFHTKKLCSELYSIKL